MGLGEIRIFAGNFAPEGWAICDGAMLQIQEYGDLYNEIKTRYGGDGRTTFSLPDLRGRAPMHRADGAALGTKGTLPVDAARPNTDPGRLALNFIIAVKPSGYLDMIDPMLGEVRPFAFNFAPEHWERCAGSLLSIEANTALFTIIETAFGGDGTRTFALPDLEEAFPFQPNKPEERGKSGGAQVHDDGPPPATPLLVVNYCIATGGVYPRRP